MEAYSSGTYSLYQALSMLGYRPYHMYEVVQSPKHMAILDEAINAKYSGVGTPYGKAEFDKWFADYDVSGEWSWRWIKGPTNQ